MKRGMILLALILTIATAHAQLSCSIKGSCNASETDFGGLATLNNTHYELFNESNYANRICCSAPGATLDNSCSGSTTNAAFIRVPNGTSTNTHVELANMTNASYEDVCIGSDIGTLSVAMQDDSGACTGRDTCLMTVFPDTNAHVGDCASGAYTTSVCGTLISVASGSEVPEFSDVALAILLGGALVGVVVMRRKR